MMKNHARTLCSTVTTCSLLKLTLLLVLLEILHVEVQCKVWKPCELAEELYTKYHVTWKLIPDWVCTAIAATGLNSSYIQNIPLGSGNTNYGIFRINNRNWCHDGHEEKNACNVNCTDLVGDDITNSVRCAQMIYKEDGQFESWSDWTKRCKGQDVKTYVRGCNLLPDQADPVITTLPAARNKSFELGLENQYLNCEATGNPPPDLTWRYNRTRFPELFTKSEYPSNPTSTEGGNTSLKLIFPSVNFSYNGAQFECVADNVGGEANATFSVSVVKETRGISTTSVLSYGLGIGIPLLVVVLVAILVTSILAYKLYTRNKNGLTLVEIKEFEDGSPVAFQRLKEEDYTYISSQNIQFQPYNRLFEVDEDRIVVDNKAILGSGEFGIVLKGQDVLTGKPVAVKTVSDPKSKDSAYSKLHLKSLLSELKVMIYLGQHPHIVNLIGAKTTGLSKGLAYIFVEYCELGDLQRYLRQKKHTFLDLNSPRPSPTVLSPAGSNSSGYVSNVTDYCSEICLISSSKSSEYQPYAFENDAISTSDLYRWSYQVACGMEYLAGKKVIHGDIATRNILLADKHTAKITDFGLAKHLYNYTNYVKSAEVPLPWRWLAIESLLEMSFSTQSDVWSFGVTLWEIFNLADVPYSGGVQFSLEFIQQLQAGLRLSKPKYGSGELYDLMAECWHHLPGQRPTFESLRCSLYEFYISTNK